MMMFDFQVISGHLGWVRCVDVEPANEWFVTGAADRVIKVCAITSNPLEKDDDVIST